MKKNLCLLYGIAFLQGMVFYSPAAVLYRQEAGLTVFQISLIESLSLLLCLLLEIPWGIVADKISYRSTMILCCGFYFISKLIFWKAHTFSDFLLERVFLSFAVSGLSGVDTSLLYLSASPGSSQKAFGIYEGMGTAGLLSASACFSLFLGEHYREAALLTAAAYGGALICALFLKDTRQKENKNPLQKINSERPAFCFLVRELITNVFCQKYFFLFLAGAGLLSETIQTITVFLNQPQYTACGLTAGTIAWLYILSQIFAMISPLSESLTKKLGLTGIVSCCFLFPALLCFLLASSKNPVCSAICILGIQGFGALFQPLQTELQNRQISSVSRASLLSIQAMFLDLISAFLNPVFGWLADRTLSSAFIAGGLFCSLGFLLFIFWYRKECHKKRW